MEVSRLAVTRGRLPQELRLAGCTTLEAANRFLREHYRTEFNRRFQVQPEQSGSAFVPCRRADLDNIFCLQWQRTVNRDNTVSFENLHLQIEPVRWRATLAGCTVTVHQHLDATLSLHYGPHCLGRYDGHGLPHPHPNRITSTEPSRGRGTAPFPCNPIWRERVASLVSGSAVASGSIRAPWHNGYERRRTRLSV